MALGLALGAGFWGQAAQAGLLDDVGSAMGGAASRVKKDLKEAGQEIGLVDKDALPGGVASRLKKINQELDKAEKALAQGAGGPQDRAKRAEQNVKRANTYRLEIDKSYKGKYSPDNPQIKAADRRLAKVEEKVQAASSGEASAAAPAASAAGGQTTQASAKLPGGAKNRLGKVDKELAQVERVLGKSASADWRAKQADMHLKSAQDYLDEIAKSYPEAMGHPEVQAAQASLARARDKVAALQGKVAAADSHKQKAAASAKDAEALSQEWIDKLKPFVSPNSGKELATYASDDENLWRGWEAIHAELAPLWDEYQKTDFSGGKSPELQAVEKHLKRYLDNYDSNHASYANKKAEDAAKLGRFVFSKEPPDPANPSGLTQSFKAGDHIYALALATKPWSEIYRSQNNAPVRIDVLIDGKKIHAQFVELKKPAYLARKYLVFEIAPEKITAYSDPDIVYGKSTATLRQGPMEMLDHLSKLAPGKHSLDFKVAYYGDTYVQGGFTIEGDDFKVYQAMAQKAAGAAAKSVTLPPARMTNKALEAKMRELTANAGWPEVYRLNIIDKDWWLDRMSGGNSPVKSRHMAAAVMAKDGDGYFYKVCTFHQPKLITGAWGELELTRTGDRVPVAEENKDK
ncbi:hypothetical protein AAU61_04535 [Desulfocarbo indianensis]|nr:hypothetical protein AAU61_04535 [Desulfocarbo indianensis]